MADTGVADANFKQEIGRRIAIRRRELGLTQKALAVGAGLSRDFLAQVEVGRLEINAGDVPRMCVALGVPVSYFFSDLVKSPTDDPMLEGIRNLSAVAQGELTPQEAILMHDFRTLDESARDAVSDVAREMAWLKQLLEATRRRGATGDPGSPPASGERAGDG